MRHAEVQSDGKTRLENRGRESRGPRCANIVDGAPPIPAGLPSTREAPREAEAWLDRATGAVREGLLAHMEIEHRKDALSWVIQTEQLVRRYAETHWSALLRLSDEDRHRHLVSLLPILHLVTEDRGMEASMLFRLRLGPWHERPMTAMARQLGLADVEDAAADAMNHVATALADPTRRGRHDPWREGAQPQFLTWVRTCSKNRLVDARRKHARLVETKVEIASAPAFTLEHDLLVAQRIYFEWQQQLPGPVSVAHTAWRDHDGRGKAWDVIGAEHPEACGKNTFYRMLTVLNARLRMAAGLKEGGRNPTAAVLRELEAWQAR